MWLTRGRVVLFLRDPAEETRVVNSNALCLISVISLNVKIEYRPRVRNQLQRFDRCPKSLVSFNNMTLMKFSLNRMKLRNTDEPLDELSTSAKNPNLLTFWFVNRRPNAF